MPKALKFSDLYLRVLSALVILCVAVSCIYLGNIFYVLLLLFLTAVIFFEANALININPNFWNNLVLATLAVGCLSIFIVYDFYWNYILLFLPPIFLSINSRSNRLLGFLTGILIVTAISTYLELKLHFSNLVIFWLITCVIASDVAGYFIGRIIGGPKIWIMISPNKTWSGTLAGWLFASLVGLLFFLYYDLEPQIIILSCIVAIFSQVGDFYESWLKRRIGKKDSSQLIPGHGGVLDRFDGIIGGAIGLKVILLFVSHSILAF